MQFEKFLHGVEYAAQGICLRVAGDVFDVPVGQQVEIEFRPHALQRLRQVQCRNVRRLPLVRRFRERAQDRCVMPRTEREALVDHDGGQIGVEHRGAECVLEAADEHRFIDERIQRPAQAAPVRGQTGPARGWRAGHDQHLKIRPMGFRARESWMQATRRRRFAIIMHIPIALRSGGMSGLEWRG